MHRLFLLPAAAMTGLLTASAIASGNPATLVVAGCVVLLFAARLAQVMAPLPPGGCHVGGKEGHDIERTTADDPPVEGEHHTDQRKERTEQRHDNEIHREAEQQRID
jgi:hypothetical protein